MKTISVGIKGPPGRSGHSKQQDSSWRGGENTTPSQHRDIMTRLDWCGPRSGVSLDRSISVSSHDGDDSGASSSQPSQQEDTSGLVTRPSPNTESKRRRRHSYEREAILKFFGMDVIHTDKEKFLSSLQDTLQQKFPKVPKASWEVFTHNVTMARQKSSDDTNMASQRESEEETGLPTTFSAMGV